MYLEETEECSSDDLCNQRMDFVVVYGIHRFYVTTTHVHWATQLWKGREGRGRGEGGRGEGDEGVDRVCNLILAPCS